VNNVLKSERMGQVVITAPKIYLETTIKELYNLNVVHIIHHTKKDLDIGNPLANASKLSETLISVRAMISNLGLQGDVKLSNGFKAMGVKNFAHLSKEVKNLQDQINLKLDKIKELENELKNIETKNTILQNLKKIGLSLESYTEYSSIKYFVGEVDEVDLLRKRLSHKTDEFELHTHANNKRSLAALFIVRNMAEDASELLTRHNFSELDMSLIKDSKGFPADALSANSSKHSKLIKSKEALQKQLQKIATKWKDFLLLSEKFLSAELDKAEAPLMFASSENIFVVSGWYPERNTKHLTERLEKVTKGNVEIDVRRPHSEENVPVKLVNTKLAKPFEFLMRLYALPVYKEIDPTIFVSLTFPLFFGIILGDIGYGLTVMVMLMFLSKKLPSARPLARIVMPSAIASVIFGFIFGEVFGFEVIFGYHLPQLISRLHQITEMLMLSLIIGLLHINLGILIGFINEMSHGLQKAILAKGSWWLLQLGVLGIAASATGYIQLPMYFGVGLAIISVIMIYMGESVSGLIEIPALFSHVLSYSRLMAVGLASVGLALVVNGFVEDFASMGGIMIGVAVLVGVIGHSLNIALGLLGGFLQSLRLHYVEFFTKFFKGGAVPFQPFGKKLEEVT